MDRPNNRAELIALARDAVRGITPALAVFRELARRAGYEGRPGGVHLPGGEVTRCCASWAELAEQVLDPERYYTQDRMVAALGLEPEPATLPTGRGDNGIGVAMSDLAGPSVRLTPAYVGRKPEASDAELLQLLTLLDGGAEITRRLYHQWRLTGRHSVPFPTNDEALARAASYAVLAGLAHAGLRSAEAGYVLTAEPVHLDTGNGQTKCGRSTAAPVGTEIRHRVTTDPAKVTHERCRTT